MEIRHTKKRTLQTGIAKGVSIPDNRVRDLAGRVCPPAVNMVVKCVRHYSKQVEEQVVLKMPVTRALKTIYLKHRLWNEFEYWWRSLCPENESEVHIKMLTCFGVEIKKGNRVTGDDMYWDFYPQPTAYA